MKVSCFKKFCSYKFVVLNQRETCQLKRSQPTEEYVDIGIFFAENFLLKIVKMFCKNGKLSALKSFKEILTQKVHLKVWQIFMIKMEEYFAQLF
jgi:hypothetical protein